MYIYIHTHVYTYTYVYIYIYTYIYIYIYMSEVLVGGVGHMPSLWRAVAFCIIRRSTLIANISIVNKICAYMFAVYVLCHVNVDYAYMCTLSTYVKGVSR